MSVASREVVVDGSVEFNNPVQGGTPIVINVVGPYKVVVEAVERGGKVTIGGLEVRKSRPTLLPSSLFINTLSVIPDGQIESESVDELANILKGEI